MTESLFIYCAAGGREFLLVLRLFESSSLRETSARLVWSSVLYDSGVVVQVYINVERGAIARRRLVQQTHK